MIENVKKYLDENNFSYEERGKNIQVDCPLCTDTRKRLGIRIEPTKPNTDDHPWKCFNCSVNGLRLATLKKAVRNLKDKKDTGFVRVQTSKEKHKVKQGLAEACNEALFNEKNEDALNYLINERGISLNTIKKFKLGFRRKFKSKNGTYDAGPHIALPIFEKGECIYLKYRNIEPNVQKKYKWRREEGCKTALFNGEVTLNHEYGEIFIVESEIDCLTMYSNGFKNTIGLTAGADTFKNMQEWYDQLERFKKIYIILDNDHAGIEGAKKIAYKLGLGRCYIVNLPEDTKDPNDYFKVYSKDDFLSLIQKARKYNPSSVINLDTLIRDRIAQIKEDIIQDEGLKTGYKSIDDVLGPMVEGSMIVVAGRPKVGKTTFVLNILHRMAKVYGINSFNYQCEMEQTDLLNMYQRMTLPQYDIEPIPNVKRDENGVPVFKTPRHERLYNELRQEHILALKTLTMQAPIRKLMSFHPETAADLELDKVCEKITIAVQRYGCKVVVFDNLHFLCRGDNVVEMIDKTTQRFKMLARHLGIVLFVVTHPRKTNHNNELSNDDLKSSGSIFQDADAVVLLHRAYLTGDEINLDDEEDEDEGLMDNIMSVKVTARRHKGGRARVIYYGDKSMIIDDSTRVKNQMFDRREKLDEQRSKRRKR